MLSALGRIAGALTALMLGFAFEMSAAGQQAGAAVARGIAVLSAPVLSALGFDVLRDGVELRAPVEGWAVVVSEVCDGMGLVVALVAVLAVLGMDKAKPGQGGTTMRRIIGRALAGLALIQIFNILRVVVLAATLARWPSGFDLVHEQVFPLLTLVLIAALVLPARQLAGLAGLTALLALAWAPLTDAAARLLVPAVNWLLALLAPAPVGEIAETGGGWSVGTFLAAGLDPVRLYLVPFEPRHFLLAVPALLAASLLARRPAWLLLILVLIPLTGAVAAMADVLGLAGEIAPATLLVPDGTGAYVPRDYTPAAAAQALLVMVQNTLVHFLLLVLAPLILAPVRGRS